MRLSDKQLRAFSDIVNSSRKESLNKKQNSPIYGTVVKEGNNVSVILDGSTIATPASSLVGVDNGDRVDVIIQNHKAVITGNHTSPAITKFGDVYVTMSEDGVIVGKLDEDEQPTGASILIDPTTGEFRIVDTDGLALARFGTEAQIGRDDRPHSLTKGTEFQIVSADGTVVAKFAATSTVNRLVAERVSVVPDNGVSGLVYVTGKDANGAVTAYGGLDATPSGSLGLYDSNHQDWMIWSDKNGNVYSKIDPMILYNGEATPTTISETTYKNVTVSGLNNWSMVAVQYRVGAEYGTIIFARGSTATRNPACYYGGRLVRGSFTIDWTNNRMRLRCLNGNTGDHTLVVLQQIVGMFRR